METRLPELDIKWNHPIKCTFPLQKQNLAEKGREICSMYSIYLHGKVLCNTVPWTMKIQRCKRTLREAPTGYQFLRGNLTSQSNVTCHEMVPISYLTMSRAIMLRKTKFILLVNWSPISLTNKPQRGEVKQEAQNAPKLSGLSCSIRNPMQSRACSWGRFPGRNSSETLEAGYRPWEIMMGNPNSSQYTQKSQGHTAEPGVRGQGTAALISTSRCPEPWKSWTQPRRSLFWPLQQRTLTATL